MRRLSVGAGRDQREAIARMSYDPSNHRRSMRLKGCDYSRPGAYFVTICVQQRECLLGEIVADAMLLNHAGRMVESWWTELADKFPTVESDEKVVMPNHFHGIIVIVGPPDRTVGAALCGRPPLREQPNSPDERGRPHRGALPWGILWLGSKP